MVFRNCFCRFDQIGQKKPVVQVVVFNRGIKLYVLLLFHIFILRFPSLSGKMQPEITQLRHPKPDCKKDSDSQGQAGTILSGSVLSNTHPAAMLQRQ